MAVQSRIRRRIAIILKSVCVALLATITAGFIYEQVGRRQDRRRLPQIGRAVDVGGRTLNIYCSGEGSPAVILDSGSGDPGYVWAHIQPEIARFTRACWFDRAGEGWSDPGPFPRTSAAMAKDLHELLTRAGLPPPYVLVGHSLGGLNARVYNGLYSSEVAGMVLVDAAHEDEPKRAPKFMLGRTLPRYLWRPLHLAARAALRIGLVRLTTRSAAPPEAPAQRTREQIAEALRRQPKAVANLMDATVPESYAQARSAGGFGDRPLIVLTRGKTPLPSGDAEIDRQFLAYEQIWMREIQPQLVRLSTRGRHVLVEKSGHRIPEEAPEVVLDAVREVVMVIRGEHASSRRNAESAFRASAGW